MLSTSMYLPDINIWLAFIFQIHQHHTLVFSWFEKLPDKSCAFCRMTQQGLLRLSTNPALFKDEAVSMADAWNLYDRLIGDPRFLYVQEPGELDFLWRKYTTLKQYSPKVWNDAYLAAFAKSLDFAIITLDKGFKKYKEAECVILSE